MHLFDSISNELWKYFIEMVIWNTSLDLIMV